MTGEPILVLFIILFFNGVPVGCKFHNIHHTSNRPLTIIMSSKEPHVYVLSLTSVDHGRNYRPEHEIVGVYSTKAAAAYAAGSVDTEYGTFDSAIESMFEDDHVDNRENPPDSGVLIQIGSEDTGEGDYVELSIEKFPLETATGSSSGKSKKIKKRKLF